MSEKGKECETHSERDRLRGRTRECDQVFVREGEGVRE